MSETKENTQEAPEQAAEAQKSEAAQKPAEADEMSAFFEMAEAVSTGKLELMKPILNGEKTHTELKYDFTVLSALELARALDTGSAGRRSDAFSLGNTQALALFAAAAAKVTPDLDATDIRERLGALDGVVAIQIASVFFRATSLAGNSRYTKQ